MRINATRNAGGSVEVADRGAFGGAHPLDLLVDIGVLTELDVSPGRHGIGRDDLDRLVELSAESGGQVGMAADHGVHGIAQPVGVERAGDGDVQLHRVHVVGRCRWAVLAWNSSPCCSGVSGKISAMRSSPAQLVDLLLVEPGRRDIRRGQPAAAASDVGADAGQGVKPQLAEPADLLRRSSAEGAQVQVACRCGPVSVSRCRR